ncbi:MAG: D-inositol-3-phosphate glycosyltransferase [Syntrophorhabdus sp. PtaU1.Bin153]|nr:MAG: D-inositol-3-phosphate glycosyltransferase [Syntrophorhabdus sp. PtaU1.Bin153]
MRGLQILILAPSVFPEVTGNAVTAERWRRSLVQRGMSVAAMAVKRLGAADFLKVIDDFRPDVIHVHHVSRSGALFLDPLIARRCAHVPLVVSPAGTDIFDDPRASGGQRERVTQVCARASVIVTQGSWTTDRITEFLPDFRGSILHVPKTFCWFGDTIFDMRKVAGWSTEDLVFFLPAGIRPVKGNLECLLAFKTIHALRPHVRIAFAGPALDPQYAARFEKTIEEQSGFARWIDTIPPDAMRSAYRDSDVVLNTSFSEGFSNALVEAVAAGKPVLASDIPGNRWLVLGGAEDLPAGFLFRLLDRDDFTRQALELIDNQDLRRRLGQGGLKRASSWPSPEEEAEGLIMAYEEAIRRHTRQ